MREVDGATVIKDWETIRSVGVNEHVGVPGLESDEQEIHASGGFGGNLDYVVTEGEIVREVDTEVSNSSRRS